MPPLTPEGRRREKLRRRYKPEAIRLLLVGESPPANGTFFYKGDSRLAKYTRLAMEGAYDREFAGNAAFLTSFCRAKYYLDDLCLEPVNNIPRAQRRLARAAAVEGLRKRMLMLRPKRIVCIMMAIAPFVEAAASESLPKGMHVDLVPFPAQGHQREYVEQLEIIMRDT